MRVIAACIAVFALVLPLPAGAEEAETGSISGTVVEDGPGKSERAPGQEESLEGICVQVYEAPRDLRFVAAETDADGTYAIEGLEPSTYHVWFRDCREERTHLSEWHEDAEMRGDATPVVVAAGETTEVDAALDLGGTVSGVVTDEESTDPIEGIWIHLIGVEDFLNRFAITGEDGAYRITGLPEGDYKVFFYDYVSPVDHVAEYYEDAETFEEADRVSVSLRRETSGIDAALEPMLRPDLAVQGIHVEEVADQEPGPTFLHEVTVSVENVGRIASEGLSLVVEACPRTFGDCRPIAEEDIDGLAAGDGFTRTYEWDVRDTGVVGEVVVGAEVVDFEDVNFHNNRDETSDEVLVEDTGVGVGPREP